MEEQNKYLGALKENFNVVGLSTAVALSAALLTPIPLLAALAAEAVYLAFVPDSKWYESRLAARYDAQVLERREAIKREVLPQLRPVLQARWMKLESLREHIALQGRDDPRWFRPIVRKLDFLLEKWLQFAQRETQFSTYLTDAHRQAHAPQPGSSGVPVRPPAARSEDEMVTQVSLSYEREIGELRKRAEAESSFASKSLLESRIEVLQRRRDWVSRLAKMQGDLRHQLELLEDTFGLINDQIRARAPELVLADLENIVWQTNTTAQLLEEFSSLDSSGNSSI